MKIRPTVSGSSAFMAVFMQTLKNTTMREKTDPSRLYFLRCSALPYCPRNTLFKWASYGLNFDMDAMMAYYVGVGHAVHDMMQRYLALSGMFVADYKCRGKCGKWHRLSTKSKCCGVPCQYNEVNIDYKGIKGHIDAILKVGDDYYIVDFKTTSLSASKTKKNKPGIAYMRQVRAYAYLLWKQHGIKVKGVMLVFLPRDNPKNVVIWEEPVTPRSLDQTRLDLKADRKLHKQTMEASTMEDFKELLKHRCGADYCDGCKAPTPGLLRLLKEQRKQFPIKQD
jgi:hypothetical protein